FERVVHAYCRENELRHGEVAAESPCPTLDRLAATMLGELLEEVLDQVLLGQTLEHLDLLDRDSRLVGDRAGELELAGPVCDECAEELVPGHERDGDACGAASPADLGSELAETDRLRLAAPFRVGEAAQQPVFVGVAQVEADGLRAEQLPRPSSDLRTEHIERFCSGDRLGEFGELFELAQALAG